MRYTLTIAHMQAMAEERGGKCLSTEYVGLEGVLTWQCAEGHVWEKSAWSVRHSKSWYPECRKAKCHENLKQYSQFKHPEQIGPNGEKLRVCNRCEIAKPHNEMSKSKKEKDGIRSICKECKKIEARKEKEKRAAKEGRTMMEYREKNFNNLSNEELLGHLIRFQVEHGRPPASVDLESNPNYPHAYTYYRRFKYNADGTPAKSWLDILVLAGLTPLDYDKIWPAWEYLVEVACEKLRGKCVYQPYKMFEGFRPDIVLVDEKVIVDAATSNYKSQHKEKQFQAAKKAGYSVEYWCLYRTTENGINEPELKYVFADEIIEQLAQIGEHQLCEDIRNLFVKYDGYE